MKNASLIIHPEELSRAWIDRVADAGIPTLALHPVGGVAAAKSLSDMVASLCTPEYRALLDYAAERGLSIEYEMHSARYLLPEAEFDTHPEWFRMNKDGERTADYNLCASCDEAVDFVAARAVELARALYRSTDRYFFWLDDAKDAFCHCPECRKLTPSEQQMKILNRMLGRLKVWNPSARLAYLAYFECILPPRAIVPDTDIFLEYAPFERNFHRPLREDAQSAPILDLLSTFGKDGAKVLDYWYDNSLYSNWTKPPREFFLEGEVMRDDFDFYQSLGFLDFSSFACYLGEDYEVLFGEVDLTPFAECYRALK